MNAVEIFEREREERVVNYRRNAELQSASRRFIDASFKAEYSYNFSWLGRPIIQHPQDIVAMQELIWESRPDLIIETGVAHGGSIIFFASMMELLGRGHVLGVDIEIRPHNREAIERHSLGRRISLVEGSSVELEIVSRVKALAETYPRVMVVLDSFHTHAHVLEELALYSPLVTEGCYLIVFDTAVEELGESALPDRPWGLGDNPMTAVGAFMAETDRFELRREYEDRVLISMAPGGVLKCVRD